MMDKANRLQNIEESRISEIFVDILSKNNYANIEKQDKHIITCEITNGLSVSSTVVYIYNKSLSGENVVTEELIIEINEVFKKYNPNNLILVSGYNISSNSRKLIFTKTKRKIQYTGNQELTKLVTLNIPNFWTYENFDLGKYERYFLEEMTEESSLLNIQGLESKAKKLLEIYIKPRIYEVIDDFEKEGKQFIRASEEEIVNHKQSCIIEGDTGSGKSTLLKVIGKNQIKAQEELKTLPVIVTPIQLINSDYNIKVTIEKLLNSHLDMDFDTILKSYNILLLIDNIDEFEKIHQQKVVSELNELNNHNHFRFILTTRSLKAERINSFNEDIKLYQLRKFNDLQVRTFVAKFFNNEQLSNDLIHALQDYRILERLPLTPLSLSLIALVYEKENYEIPATISDIYNNFNSLILGKSTATKRFELINFNFKERLLSVYALEMMNKNNGRPFTKEEFIGHFKKYFNKKSSKIAPELIEEFLHFFIENSGILKIEESNYVNFSHRSFLEYYASLEIFKHKREEEDKLVKNFLDLNWQNISIFYAGQSKDMPSFLKKIIIKVSEAEVLDEHNNAIMGLGYLLQALYQTDNKLRQEAVELALEQSLITHEVYKKITAEGEIVAFKNMKLPSLSIFNMYFFYMNFLSSTLCEPLELTFESLYKSYLKNKDTTTGYKLLSIAAIFHSDRIGNSKFLERLLFESPLIKDPYLVTIGEFSLYFDSSSNHKNLRTELAKAFIKFNAVTKELLRLPAERMRFGALDLISTDKKITILTEGKTDALIIEHAYSVLTNGKIPYWNIRPVGNEVGGGAKNLKFTLDKAVSIIEEDILIGVFDYDQEGYEQFNGYKSRNWNDRSSVKKNIDSSIYALTLPIPVNRKAYASQEIEHLYLTIEHYFSDELLTEHGLTSPSGIPGINKISGSSSVKVKFAKFIKSIKTPEDFQNFIPLFELFDQIASKSNFDYHELI